MKRVDELADQLLMQLQARAAEIAAVHIHNAQSGSVQSVVSTILKGELDFDEEVVLLPEDQFVTRARPDFYFDLGDSRGVLAEVERGGATTNNHDIKDLWKAHVSPNAQHLFLIVPLANISGTGKSREKPYPLVARRLGAFFGNPRREIDVVNLHVYGY